jgi:hypothetical protein
MVDQYLHSAIRLHGVVLNKFSRRKRLGEVQRECYARTRYWRQAGHVACKEEIECERNIFG